MVNLLSIYSKLLEERRFVVEPVGAADGGGKLWSGRERGGCCGGVDVEGEEGDGSVGGSRGLEWGGGAALLRGGKVTAGAENHRRNISHGSVRSGEGYFNRLNPWLFRIVSEDINQRSTRMNFQRDVCSNCRCYITHRLKAYFCLAG